MRFLTCHITGFGKFKERTFDLSKDINCILAENGWGKTTLAAFLECMLYGMDSTRARSLDENDRVKYEPWSGGAYGGVLTFLYRDEKYRVERFFGKTPSADVGRVYDQNNAPCYAFGERAERLGETLLKMNRESYRRIAYFAQNKNTGGALPEDTRVRLLSLFNAQAERGGEDALARLDAAERALRAKRRPAKGKLDELEERLAALSARRIQCEAAASESETLARAIEKQRAELESLKNAEERLSKQAEACARQNEFAARQATEREIREKATEAERALQGLEDFFGGIKPEAVNLDGLQNAVAEYYALLESTAGAEQERFEAEKRKAETEALQIRISALNQSIEAYERALAQEKKRDGAGTRSTKKKGKGNTLLTVLSFALALLGAVLVDSVSAVGILLLAVGGAGVLYTAIRAISEAGINKRGAPDKELLARYRAAIAERDSLFAQLAEYTVEASPTEGTEAAQKRMEGLKTGIEAFLRNFRFETVYDYRACVAILKERIAAYEKYARVATECGERLAACAPTETVSVFADADLTQTRFELSQIARKKEDLLAALAQADIRLRALEETAAEASDCAGEEARLCEEHARLERRLLAVQTAKEILLRAKESLASRYLEPVERGLRSYAALIGQDRILRFSADGVPVYEEKGVFRSMDYYSAGEKELAALCTRFALAEAVGSDVLVLDDPFSELDDMRLAKAKRLLDALSAKYQIVYFTCAKDRTL